MTTKIKITNKANSNGDVHVRGVNLWEYGTSRLAPGESSEFGITDSSLLSVFETMPSSVSDAGRTSLYYGEEADKLIAAEIAGQDKMWGTANDRADVSGGQMLAAALAQSHALHARRVDGTPIDYRSPPAIYPADWGGFRDYGSDIANLVVAAAYLRQEIKRLIANGEPMTRLTRDQATQPFTADQPAFPADPRAPVASQDEEGV